MAKRKSTKPAEKVKPRPAGLSVQSPAKKAVQEAGMITGQLVAKLKNVTTGFLDIGALLVQVRDRKLYEPLHDPDLETYADRRLDLGRSSLYGYIKVYEWVKLKHPEWLVRPARKRRIPNLTKIYDLMQIEDTLAQKDVDPDKRAGLEKLRKKAIAGKLRRGELADLSKRTPLTSEESLRKLLSDLRTARRRAVRLQPVTPDIVSGIDHVIGLVANLIPVHVARLDRLHPPLDGDSTASDKVFV
jgi:hypothetical protein